MREEYIAKYCNYQTAGNWFHDFNPLSKLNILLALAFTALVMQNVFYGLGLCIFYYIFAIICGRLKYYNKIFSKLLIVIGVFIVVIRIFSVEGTDVLWSLGSFRITREALTNGFNMAFIILGFSGAIIIFYAVTPMAELMYALEHKGVSHTTSYIMLASFQTIIDLKANAETILSSQKARGIETDGNVFVRVKALFPVLGPLLLGAISSAEEKSIAMDARAFSVERKHTFLRDLRPVPNWERVVVVLVDIYFLAICALRVYTVFFAGKGA